LQAVRSLYPESDTFLPMCLKPQHISVDWVTVHLLGTALDVNRHVMSTTAVHSLQAFEETLDAWMAEWHTYLSLDVPGLAESDPDKESVLDSVKATVRRPLAIALALGLHGIIATRSAVRLDGPIHPGRATVEAVGMLR
jgi:hypothetical protein